MNGPTFVPAAWRSPAFLGPARVAGVWTGAPPAPGAFRRALGQAVRTPTDLPSVVSSDEYARQAWTKDDALAAYNLANLFWNVQQKLQYTAYMLKQMEAVPGLLDQMQDKNAFVDAADAIDQAARAAALPNATASMQNLITALETRVLPSFGIGVKGTRAFFRTQAGLAVSLDCVSTDTTAGKAETVDFGDLCATNVSTDLKALEVAQKKVQDLAPEIKAQLGSPLVLAAIAITIIITVYMITAAWEKSSEAALPPIRDPNVLAFLDRYAKRNPKAAEEFTRGMPILSGLLAKPGADPLVWVGVAAIALAGAWAIASIAGVFGGKR